MTENNLTARMPRPKIGLLPTGHEFYWDQFPGLKEKCMAMLGRFRQELETIGDVIVPPLVDTPEKAEAAGELFRREEVDLVLIFRWVTQRAWSWCQRSRT